MFLRTAVSRTWARSARSCSPASAVFRHGSVETSSTDSISSGLISPTAGAGSSMLSIALTSSSESASRIISSSSIPIVYGSPWNLWSIGRQGSRRLGLRRPAKRRDDQMALGYQGKLYILAFDHRGSFQKKMFGIQGDPTAEETATIEDAKRLIFEGMLEAVQHGAEPGATGVLVDEQFGSDVPARAEEAGLRLAMPVEKSGQNEFDFEYGDDFGAHIERFDPDFSKVLVRYNP